MAQGRRAAAGASSRARGGETCGCHAFASRHAHLLHLHWSCSCGHWCLRCAGRCAQGEVTHEELGCRWLWAKKLYRTQTTRRSVDTRTCTCTSTVVEPTPRLLAHVLPTYKDSKHSTPRSTASPPAPQRGPIVWHVEAPSRRPVPAGARTTGCGRDGRSDGPAQGEGAPRAAADHGSRPRPLRHSRHSWAWDARQAFAALRSIRDVPRSGVAARREPALLRPSALRRLRRLDPLPGRCCAPVGQCMRPRGGPTATRGHLPCGHGRGLRARRAHRVDRAAPPRQGRLWRRARRRRGRPVGADVPHAGDTRHSHPMRRARPF